MKSCWLNCTSPIIMSMHRYSMHTLQRTFAIHAIWLRSKRDVKTCMRLSPPMNSKRLRKERNTRERASSSEAFHIESFSRCARGGAFSSLSHQTSVLSNAALDSPIRADNFAQSARLRVHTLAAANFSTRGDALRIMQRSHRARPLICA